ncbi:MAG: hypothetical protein GY948_05205 [Alphaproteobacteria bacterium]|nr:hypothetical protein [Alphaproteobacteria bacterium]
MSQEWKFQLRVTLKPQMAEIARSTPESEALGPLPAILKRHNAALNCQHDAFAGYVAEAEANNVDDYPLYAWTKATIEDPVKEAKYIKSFTLYAGGEEVYEKTVADALLADIEPLVGGPVIAALNVHDTNPANNPQPPKR